MILARIARGRGRGTVVVEEDPGEAARGVESKAVMPGRVVEEEEEEEMCLERNTTLRMEIVRAG